MMRGFFPGGFDSYGSYGYNMMGDFWWVGMIAKAAFWVLIIWAVIYVVKRLTNTTSLKGSVKNDEALAIVRERYAKGELTKEQYDQLINDLK